MPLSEIEELVMLIQPEEMKRVQEAMAARDAEKQALPITYTIMQLLKSFSGITNGWERLLMGGLENLLSR